MTIINCYKIKINAIVIEKFVTKSEKWNIFTNGNSSIESSTIIFIDFNIHVTSTK